MLLGTEAELEKNRIIIANYGNVAFLGDAL